MMTKSAEPLMVASAVTMSVSAAIAIAADLLGVDYYYAIFKFGVGASRLLRATLVLATATAFAPLAKVETNTRTLGAIVAGTLLGCCGPAVSALLWAGAHDITRDLLANASPRAVIGAAAAWGVAVVTAFRRRERGASMLPSAATSVLMPALLLSLVLGLLFSGQAEYLIVERSVGGALLVLIATGLVATRIGSGDGRLISKLISICTIVVIAVAVAAA